MGPAAADTPASVPARSVPPPRRSNTCSLRSHGVLVTQAPRQRSFDDLGRPLSEVTFVVLDLETTGGSPATCEITEVGAVKFRGGELLGTFHTLVNPGVPIPPEIVYLTGITEAMVWPAPKVEAVLGPLVSFVGRDVIVGHNVRFDLGFLAAA